MTVMVMWRGWDVLSNEMAKENLKLLGLEDRQHDEGGEKRT